MMGSNHRAIIPISAEKLLTLSQFVMRSSGQHFLDGGVLERERSTPSWPPS
jgi:hypothetical protein